MDFDVSYSDTHEAFRSEVRAFVDANVPGELRHTVDYYGEPYDTYQLRRQLGRALGARGWLYPMAPREYGGGGLDLDSALIIIEELQRVELPLPPYYDSGGALGNVAIRVWGTDEQKKAILPPIYRGDVCAWQLLTEPGAGSDLAAVSTSAVRAGDHYVLTGEKVFIGNTHRPEALWTIVRTGAPGDRHRNLSWFWIDAGTPGITTTPLRLIGGDDKHAVHSTARGSRRVGSSAARTTGGRLPRPTSRSSTACEPTICSAPACAGCGTRPPTSIDRRPMQTPLRASTPPTCSRRRTCATRPCGCSGCATSGR